MRITFVMEVMGGCLKLLPNSFCQRTKEDAYKCKYRRYAYVNIPVGAVLLVSVPTSLFLPIASYAMLVNAAKTALTFSSLVFLRV